MHIVDLLGLFLLLQDVFNAVLELGHILLVQGSLLVQLALCLAKLILEGIDFLLLLGLLLEEQTIVGQLHGGTSCWI